MDYINRLSEIFDGKGPTNLRTIFDCDSNQWHDTTMEKKVFFLARMIESGYPLEKWIEDYKKQFASTHPHILKSIEKSIELIEGKMENEMVIKQINIYLEEVPKRRIEELSKKFLFNAYFDLKEGMEIACIKRAYRDMNRTLLEFQIVKVGGQKDLKKIEENREVVRNIWQQFLVKKILELKAKVFENNEEFDLWHSEFCSDLMVISTHKLTLGQAQKWINMIIKYLVVFGEESILRNIRYFHIPIDSLIMDELYRNKMFNIAKLDTPWSKITEMEKYLDYQNQFREIVNPKIPLEMEFEIFNKIIIRGNKINE